MTAATPKPLLVRSRAPIADTGFRWLSMASGSLVLLLLVGIAWAMTSEAWPAFSKEGLGFVTDSRWAPNEGHFGAYAFVFGTIVVSAIALVFAVPVSVGIALFVTEIAPAWLRRPVTFLLDLLAAVPSVVFGLWGITVLAVAAPGFYDSIGGALGALPAVGTLFGGTPQGKSFMTGGIILALMITPIITSITREVFDTTPRGQKEAALALACTRWEMIRGAVLPHSKAGVAGAVLLGLGRAMGETIAAALVIGSAASTSLRLFGPGDALAARIANEFGEATGDWRAALIGLGVVLFGVTIVVNLIAEAIVRRAERVR